jgi:hypothetical protein
MAWFSRGWQSLTPGSEGSATSERLEHRASGSLDLSDEAWASRTRDCARAGAATKCEERSSRSCG